MLVLKRKSGEAIRVGNLRFVILSTGRGGVRVGIEAPRDVAIVRDELDDDPDDGTPEAEPSPDESGPGTGSVEHPTESSGALRNASGGGTGRERLDRSSQSSIRIRNPELRTADGSGRSPRDMQPDESSNVTSCRLAVCSRDATEADGFRPLMCLRRRSPDAGSSARLHPGSSC